MAKRRLLIVDDDEIVRSLFVRIAEHINIDAVTAGNVAEAKGYLKKNHAFDIIILDLIMPNENGWDFLDELKADPKTTNIPVIITTGAQLSNTEMDNLLKKTCAVVHKGTFEVNSFKKLLNDLL